MRELRINVNGFTGRTYGGPIARRQQRHYRCKRLPQHTESSSTFVHPSPYITRAELLPGCLPGKRELLTLL